MKTVNNKKTKIVQKKLKNYFITLRKGSVNVAKTKKLLTQTDN